MSNEKKKYDSTVARIAGNILSADCRLWLCADDCRAYNVKEAVATARAIIAETERTTPAPVSPGGDQP